MKSAALDKAYIINIHNEISQQAEIGATKIILKTVSEVELYGNLVLLRDDPTGSLLVIYQMFLNVIDKIEARLSWLYYVIYMSKHQSGAGIETDKFFPELHQIIEIAYEYEADEAVHVFKALEPLLVGGALRRLQEIQMTTD